MATSYNPQQSNFYLTYPPRKLTRVCFYINKSIHLEKWIVTHHHEDAQTLTIKIESILTQKPRTIQIHNIYNLSPQSHSSQDHGTLKILRNYLQAAEAEVEHIVVGDFNLHHPYWCGTNRPMQHAAADRLLNIMDDTALSLATLKGI